VKAADFETYYFLRLYSIDFNAAANTARMIKRYKRGDVVSALLRELAVSYARPFSVNKGKLFPKHQLSLVYVPKASRSLHSELLELRQHQFAHTDLNFHSPKISRLITKGEPIYPMSFKSFDYQALLRQLPAIETLINEVALNVNAKIKQYEQGF